MTSFTTQTVQSSFFSPRSKPQLENDVFLSFRGIDTRNSFTDYLYHALKDKGFKTFKDDEEIKLGYSISPELSNAIKKSRIAVIILSKNYASSTWCLEELVKIVECMKGGSLTVLPIFYHVDPSHVRHQNGTFAVAFQEHEKRLQENLDQVQIWRDALEVVANISGKRLTNGYHLLIFFY